MSKKSDFPSEKDLSSPSAETAKDMIMASASL